MIVADGWWQTFLDSSRWDWHGWVPIGSIATALALGALFVQTAIARGEARREIADRRDDDRRREVALERASTPYLSIEGRSSSGGQYGNVNIRCDVHVDGTGVALGAVFNLHRQLEPGVFDHVNTPEPIRFLRPGMSVPITFECPPDFYEDKPFLIYVDCTFSNSLGRQVAFRVDGHAKPPVGLIFTAPPLYRWPWDEVVKPE